MKTIQIALIVFSSFIANAVFSQNENHSTIAEVKASYKSVPNTQSNSGEFTVLPEMSVTLKSNTTATKVFVKILNATTNAVVYETNYTLSSSPVTNQAGKTLFENVNGTLHINSDQVITLKPYTYEVYTQDSQSNNTAIFSVIQ